MKHDLCFPSLSLVTRDYSVIINFNNYAQFNHGYNSVLVLCLGFRWQGGGGETAQGKHQEAERNGGAAGEGAEQAADRHRGAAGEEQERAGSFRQLL